jgi:serine protease Do
LARKVIGINSAIIMGAQNISFSIAAGTAEWVLGEIVRHGVVNRGTIGLVGGTRLAPPELRDLLKGGQTVVEVVQLQRGSPAERAGIRPGDLIVAINGKVIDWLRARALLLLLVICTLRACR